MLYDDSYKNNVVLTTDAVQELLTNIKNYPIIDIDYVSSEDTDTLHGGKIWENFTDNVPCLKITYGDSETTKGNITFLDQEDQNTIRDAQNTLQRYQAELNNNTYLKYKYERVLEEYDRIIQQKKDNATIIVNNAQKMIDNKENFLKACLGIIVFPFATYDNIREFSNFINYFTSEPTNIEYVYQNVDTTIENNTYKIQYSNLNTARINLIINILDSYLQTGNNSIFSSEAPKNFIRSFKEFIISYSMISFITELEKANIPNLSGIVETWKTAYTSNPRTTFNNETAPEILNKLSEIQNEITVKGGTQNWATNWDNLINENFIDLITLAEEQLRDIIDTLDTKIKPKRNEVSNLLGKETDSASKNTINGKIKKLNNLIDTTQAQLAELTSDSSFEEAAGANRILYGYKYVKLGNNISWTKGTGTSAQGNFDGSTEPTTPNTQQASGAFRININNKIIEVPIKGFGQKISDQPIKLRSTSGISMSASSIAITAPTISISASSGISVTGATTFHSAVTINGVTNLNNTVNIANKKNILPVVSSTSSSGDGVGSSLGNPSHIFNILYTRAIVLGSTDPVAAVTASTIRPAENGTGTLGNNSYHWDSISVNKVSNTLSALTINPATNNTYTLGTTDLRWKNIYSVSGNFSGTVIANAISATNGNFSGTVTANAISATNGNFSSTVTATTINTTTINATSGNFTNLTVSSPLSIAGGYIKKQIICKKNIDVSNPSTDTNTNCLYKDISFSTTGTTPDIPSSLDLTNNDVSIFIDLNFSDTNNLLYMEDLLYNYSLLLRAKPIASNQIRFFLSDTPDTTSWPLQFTIFEGKGE